MCVASSCSVIHASIYLNQATLCYWCHAQDVTDPQFVLRNIDLSPSPAGQADAITEGYLRRKEVQVCMYSPTIRPQVYTEHLALPPSRVRLKGPYRLRSGH